MDPNLNRMSMGSRAGTSIKPKFGAPVAPSRQGTAARVFHLLYRDLTPLELEEPSMLKIDLLLLVEESMVLKVEVVLEKFMTETITLQKLNKK